MTRICSVEGCGDPALRSGMCNVHYRRFLRHGDPCKFLKAPNGTLASWLRGAAKMQTDECILWPFASVSTRGYGLLTFEGRRGHANRFMCALVHGPPPFHNAEAAHACGNRLCVNHRHLRWATPSENQMDRVLHGTSNRGQRNAQSRLTERDVRAIRRAVGTTSQTALARQYGVSDATVSLIVNRKKWAWLE